jgi:hypothetical protein
MATKRGGGMCYHFEKNKFVLRFTSWVTKEFRSLFDNGGMLDGNQIFWVAQKGMGRKGMKWQ